VGPPDEGVVAGYDKKGDVLLGRSYFYDGSKGYYEKPDWYKDCWGLMLIGDRTRTPAKKQILREALEWAVQLARTPTSDELPTADGGRANGLAAYDAWAKALRCDENFPPGDLKVLTFRCNVNASVTLSGAREAHMTAAQFLRNNVAGADEAAKPHVLAAATAYEQEEAILHEALRQAPFCFSPEAERLKIADPDLRSTLAEMVLQAKAMDGEAVGHLEQALKRLSGE
jgi:hypothetical protein